MTQKEKTDLYHSYIKETLNETFITPEGYELRKYPVEGVFIMGIKNKKAEIIFNVNPSYTQYAWECYQKFAEMPSEFFEDVVFVAKERIMYEGKEALQTKIYMPAKEM